MTARFRPGDVVVVPKAEEFPAPRTPRRNIQPAAHGDFYSYSVEKFWRVVAVQLDGRRQVLRPGRHEPHGIDQFVVFFPGVGRFGKRLLHRQKPLALGSGCVHSFGAVLPFWFVVVTINMLFLRNRTSGRYGSRRHR